MREVPLTANTRVFAFARRLDARQIDVPVRARSSVSFFIVQLPDGRDLKEIEFVAKNLIAELV